jgi:hypothetical protein
MAHIYAGGFFNDIPQFVQFNVAAAQIDVEGRNPGKRIALRLQIKLARRLHASVRGKPGHQSVGKIGAIGDVLHA